jgi:hypothetical protein
MSEKEQQWCFVYANRLKTERDAFEKITRGYGSVRREYIVNSPSVRVEDITDENVRQRLEAIEKSLKPEESIKVVLAGFSPLVALLYDVAKDMGHTAVYFFKDDRTQDYVEIVAF